MDEDEKELKDERSLQRIHTRAALYAAPDTLLTAREFARVMGIRAFSTAQVYPRGLVQMGSSKRAPFGAWLEAWERHESQPAPRHEPSLAELRRKR